MNKGEKSLKDYFIPTPENGYRPHVFRARIAASFLALVIVIEGFFLVHTLFILPSSQYFAAIFASVLVDETNQSRETERLASLSTNPLLEKAAQLKADDMAAKGYFAHNAPDGKTPWYWFEQAGYDYAAAGENLAVNFTDSKDVTAAWLASPSHRANIMSGNYTEIGIATARGTYKGKDAIFVVQEFGRPSLVARAPSIASSSESSLAALVVRSEESPPSKAPDIAPKKSPIAPTTTERLLRTIDLPLVANATTTVAGASEEKLAVAETLAPVDGPVISQHRPSLFERMVASPREVSSKAYVVLALLVALFLFLAVVIEIRVQHPHVIVTGLLLIAVILGFLFLNGAIGWTQAIV